MIPNVAAKRSDGPGLRAGARQLSVVNLRFQLSPDGRVMRADGLNEWIDRALGIESSTNTNTGPGPGPGPRRVARAAPVAGRGTSVNSTVRNFFNQDLFRQLIEFQFLTGNPVHVSDTWTTSGDTPIGTRNRVNFDATSTFKGLQMHAGTIAPALNFEGRSAGPENPGGTNNVRRPPAITAHSARVVDRPEPRLSLETVLHKEMKLGASTSMRTQGTNTSLSLSVQIRCQSLSIKTGGCHGAGARLLNNHYVQPPCRFNNTSVRCAALLWR